MPVQLPAMPPPPLRPCAPPRLVNLPLQILLRPKRDWWPFVEVTCRGSSEHAQWERSQLEQGRVPALAFRVKLVRGAVAGSGLWPPPTQQLQRGVGADPDGWCTRLPLEVATSTPAVLRAQPGSPVPPSLLHCVPQLYFVRAYEVVDLYDQPEPFLAQPLAALAHEHGILGSLPASARTKWQWWQEHATREWAPTRHHSPAPSPTLPARPAPAPLLVASSPLLAAAAERLRW
jgi:hypothetical protein